MRGSWRAIAGIVVAAVLLGVAAAKMTFTATNAVFEKTNKGPAGVGLDLVTGAPYAFDSQPFVDNMFVMALPDTTRKVYPGYFETKLYMHNSTAVLAGTLGIEICEEGKKGVLTEIVDFQASAMGADGLAPNQVVLFSEGKAVFVEVQTDLKVTVLGNKSVPVLARLSNNTRSVNVVGGTVIKDRDDVQYFVDTVCLATVADDASSCVRTLRNLHPTGLCAVTDKAGHLYTADERQIRQYRVDDSGAATALRSIYVDRERNISGLFYDRNFDMIYTVTGGTAQSQFFRVPAGDGFVQSAIETVATTLAGSGAQVAATLERAYVLTTEGDNFGTGLGWVELQQCHNLGEGACLKDLQHCRYSLGRKACMAHPTCTEGDVCTTVVPRITAFEPRSGSVQGAVPVTVTFATPLPHTTVQGRLGDGAYVDATVSADRLQAVFLTSTSTKASDKARVQVKVASYEVTAADTFRAYECTGRSCGECAGSQDECVWLVDRGVCTSVRASEAQGRSAIVVANSNFCPAFTSQSVRVSAQREDIVLGVNTLYNGRQYVCTFRNESAATSTTGKVDWENMQVRCPSPRTSADGTYTLSVGFSGDVPVFTTLEGANVTVEYTQCSMRKDCRACIGVDGCDWAFNTSAFVCASRTECTSCVRYETACPAVRNRLYADAGTVATPHEVVLELADAQLDSTMALTCTQDGVAAAEPAQCDAHAQTCRCNLTWTRGTTGSARVALTAGGTLFVESTFYAVRCEAHGSFAACVGDASRACVWAVAEGRCGINPGRSNGTWVSAVPAVVSFTPVIDALGHNVTVVFTSMVFGVPAYQFGCELVGADAAVLATSDLQMENETHGTCAFGALAAEHGLGANQALYNVSLVVSRRPAVALRAPEDDVFAQLNANSTQRATVVNCDTDNTALTCQRCHANPLCAWSGRRALCTAVLDETASHTLCPTVTALTPGSGYFEKGQTKNITLTGTRLVSGLLVRFVPQGSGGSGGSGGAGTVEGPLVLVNDTALNYTLVRDMPTGVYDVVVVAAATQRVFADTTGIVFERQRAPMSVELLLAIVVPLGVVAVVLVVVLVVVLRRRGRRPYQFDVERKPDFARFAYATDLWAAGAARGGAPAFPDDEGARDALRALLEDRLVCAALGRATSSTEADKFTSAMVYVHATNGQCIDLLMALVEQEVQGVPNSTQLFRGNSLASKAFRAYSRMVGLEYLWLTLARFVHELDHLARQKDGHTRPNSSGGEDEANVGGGDGTVSVLSTEFEVDPTKLGAGADEEAQTYMLAQRARQLVLCITQSTAHLPAELRALAAMLAAKVAERFPDAEHIAIGGTFFLRFICPAVIAPHCYGLLLTPDRRTPVVPGDRLQRQLILLGKVLQNLANGVLFGKKEPFMLSMNDFIASNLPLVNDWMDTISTAPAGVRFAEQATPVPPRTLADSYSFLAAHIRATMPKIRAALQAQNAPPELAQRLEAAVSF